MPQTGGKHVEPPLQETSKRPVAFNEHEFILKREALRKVNQLDKNPLSVLRKHEVDSTPIKPTSTPQDNGEFFKIDLNNLEEEKSQAPKKPPVFSSVRYFIMVVALISPFVTTYSRTIINFAITDMIIEPSSLNMTNKNPLITNATVGLSTFDIDGSCPVSDDVRKRLIEEVQTDVRRAQSDHYEKYDWDTFKQGLLKGAYAIGHAPFQIPGSRFAEIRGARLVIGIGSFIIAVCCIAAPYLAAINFYLLYVDLILLGVLGSFMTPALITLFSSWLTPSEKSIMMTFYLIASRLGYALSSYACGLLIGAQYSWRYVFFSAGWISLIYCGLFSLSVRSRPPEHPLIRKEELEYIASKNTLVRESLSENVKLDPLELKQTQAKEQDVKLKQKNSAPWFAILTNLSVWSFIITKFCVKLAGDTVQIELPTYLYKVMHLPAGTNGTVNAVNYVIFCGGCLLVGFIAKYIMKRKPFGLSKTTIRKCFQSIGSFGVSMALVGMAFSVCDNTSTQFCLILIFFLTTFGTHGEAQIPLDITERYSGTIHAIGSSLAISSAIEPTLVGIFLRGHAADKESWKIIWLCASAIAFIGGLVFLIFADARIQSFDTIEANDSSDREKGRNNLAFEKDIGLDGKPTNKSQVDSEDWKQELVIVPKRSESRQI